MKGKIVLTGLLTLSCVMSIACGNNSSSNSGSNGSMSQAQVSNFMSTVAGSAVQALNTAAAAKHLESRNLKDLSARILRNDPKVRAKQLQVQCNSNGTSCTFSDNFNVAYTCQTGGTMNVAGTMNGNGTQNSAYLSLQIEVTPHDWTCAGPTVNGDPYIQVNGTYTYPADTMTMTMSGGFTAGGQSCPLNVTVNGNSNGSGDISGTACGDSINGNF